MRQEITEHELAQLTPPQRTYLDAWCARFNYPARLTIGQMMHFLDDHDDNFQITKYAHSPMYELRGVVRGSPPTNAEWYGTTRDVGSPAWPLWQYVRFLLERRTASSSTT